jgi:hypothetical protein
MRCRKGHCTEWPRFTSVWRCGRAAKTYGLWPNNSQLRNLVSVIYGHYISSIRNRLSKQVEIARKSLAKCYNKKLMSVKVFKQEELDMLN